MNNLFPDDLRPPRNLAEGEPDIIRENGSPIVLATGWDIGEALTPKPPLKPGSRSIQFQAQGFKFGLPIPPRYVTRVDRLCPECRHIILIRDEPMPWAHGVEEPS